MKRMMLYDELTGKWGWYTVSRAKSPWRVLRTRLRATMRFIHHNVRVFPDFPKTYEFDPDTLDMRDPKRERRMRRRDRRDRLLEKAAKALMSMIEMQKFIN